jgi:hypothetical protein
MMEAVRISETPVFYNETNGAISQKGLIFENTGNSRNVVYITILNNVHYLYLSVIHLAMLRVAQPI